MTTPNLAPTTLALPALAALLLAAGCGAGVAGVIAGSGSSSGGSTPALNAFEVVTPKVSPTPLRFDASQPVRVALFYDAGTGEAAMSQLFDDAGNAVPGNELNLPAGEFSLRWDFEAELSTPTYRSDVRIVARIPGGAPINGGELVLGIGNDPPVIEAVVPPTSEVSGVVPVGVRVSDSSSDVISVLVEWRRSDEPPDAWKPARAPEVLPGEDPNALEDVQVSPDGTFLVFFWDTDRDLADDESEVALRFTPDDHTLDADLLPIGEGEPVVSAPFHVDNNAPPIVQLDSGPLILNPDERRGIPIPFRVIDEEGDLVEMIFQWRREGEEFPSLDRDGNGKIENVEVDAIRADPVLRQEKHVCASYPHYAHGLVVPIDEDTLRLPELARSESWTLASGIVGRTLELLRPSSILEPITPTWSSNPLVSPIAALPIGDGLTALVLDIPGNGRLREIELATGAVVREIATLGAGIPSAMAFERGEEAVLVALDDAGTWRIERVALASGAKTELIVSDGTEPAPVRGIASLGTKALVFTVGSSLLHLDYRNPLARQLGTLLIDLATPWGVVVDPLPPNQIYVSERDANRVLAIELDSHGSLPVVVKTADLQPGILEAPEALALERHGSRMLIVTSAPGVGQELLGLDLGATGGNRSFSIGGPAADVSSVATGSDELRLLCIPASNELLVAGGIEQRRMIAAHSTTSQDVSVEPPLGSVPEPGQPWRIRETIFPLRASAQGVAGRFLWDSTEAPGSVFVRATARDDEVGVAAGGAAPKRVRGGLEVGPFVLGGSGTTDGPSSVAATDLDGDGDQDLVSANFSGSNLTVFLQLSPGSFAAPPLVLGGSGTTDGPSSVAAADLDGDGDQDLVSANFFGDNLTVFLQLSPGSFAAPPLVLGGTGTTNGPFSVAAADLDGDGDQDLVSANYGGHNLTVFLQLSPGSFAAPPLVLGGLGTTDGPISVAAADLDGDGDQDLVSANEFSNNLTVFLQLSPGSFAAPPLVLGGTGTTNGPRSVAAADLDGDGDQDLVSANLGGNNLTVFLQLSPGSFAAPPLVLGGSGTTDRPISVAAADLDGDGDQDLVSANFDGNNLTVFLQLSPGSFAAPPLVLGGSGRTNGSVSVAADLDGDGDQDLVSTNQFGSHLTVFLQLSPGSFSPPLVLGGSGTTVSPRSVAAADLDGDGDQDLVSANSSGNSVFLQLSPGSFAAPPLVLGGSSTTSGPRSVAAADLDGDGDQDLVSANEFSNNLTVFLQLSPGSFAAPPLVLGGTGTTNGPISVAAADLDGDGDQDLVSANEFSNNLTVFLQLSPGSFAASPLVLGGTGRTNGPFSVAAADLDGDGDQDLVSANHGGHNLTVFLQLSPGSFAAPPLVLGGSGTTNGPRSVAAADLDGDGDQDLVSANEFSNNLTVFLQLSPGSFAAPPLVLGGFGTTNGPFSVAAADLDGDGDQDLVSANHGGHNLTVFLQLSRGSFAAPPLVLGGSGTTDGPFSMAAADLDGDGDQDLVSANFDGNNLTVFFGGR